MVVSSYRHIPVGRNAVARALAGRGCGWPIRLGASWNLHPVAMLQELSAWDSLPIEGRPVRTLAMSNQEREARSA